MKKILYFSLLISIFFISCKENDYEYEGAQTFFFGEASSVLFTVDEDNTTHQLAYGLMYPADQDYEFKVRIVENTGGENITANDAVTGELTLKIPKGERVGYINVKANFDSLETNVDETLKFKFTDKGNINVDIVDTTYTLTVQKFCTLTPENIKEWAGIYVNSDTGDEMEMRHVAGDTLEIKNFNNINNIKIVVDYSTKKYTVKVVDGYFYTASSGDPVYIVFDYKGDPLVPQAIDFCTKEMLVYYFLKLGNTYYGYFLDHIYKVRDL